MKSTNYNYIDEAGRHQKWKQARRIPLITPLSTNCPSMQTRKPPTGSGTPEAATAGEAQGPGERCTLLGIALASLFKGDTLGDVGLKQDTYWADSSVQTLSKILLKSPETPRK